MRVIVMTKAERDGVDAVCADAPARAKWQKKYGWSYKDHPLSPDIAALKPTAREKIAKLVAKGTTDGDDWTLYYSPESAKRYPDKFAAACKLATNALRA